MLVQQTSSLHTELSGRSQVEINDLANFIEGEVANRGKIVEVCIPRAGNFEVVLHSPELFVLHFEFDLMNPQLTNKAFGLFEAHLLRPIGSGFESFLGLTSQVFGTLRAIPLHEQVLQWSEYTLLPFIISISLFYSAWTHIFKLQQLFFHLSPGSDIFDGDENTACTLSLVLNQTGIQ